MKMMLADRRVKATIDVIRGKWKAIIIKALKESRLRRIAPPGSRASQEGSHGSSPRTGKGPNCLSYRIRRTSCPNRIRNHRIRSYSHSGISGHARLGKDAQGTGAWLSKGSR